MRRPSRTGMTSATNGTASVPTIGDGSMPRLGAVVEVVDQRAERVLHREPVAVAGERDHLEVLGDQRRRLAARGVVPEHVSRARVHERGGRARDRDERVDRQRDAVEPDHRVGDVGAGQVEPEERLIELRHGAVRRSRLVNVYSTSCRRARASRCARGHRRAATSSSALPLPSVATIGGVTGVRVVEGHDEQRAAVERQIVLDARRRVQRRRLRARRPAHDPVPAVGALQPRRAERRRAEVVREVDRHPSRSGRDPRQLDAVRRCRTRAGCRTAPAPRRRRPAP